MNPAGGILPTDRLGRPVRDLRISLTDRCNFRCSYCMPAEVFGEHYEYLPRAQILTFEEIIRLAAIFCRLGVNKLRLTGGEPLLRRDLPELIAGLRRVAGDADITLTTNGYLLAGHAEALKQAGLSRITVSLDALDSETFSQLNGRSFSVEPVLDGITAAVEAGLAPVKINCVIVKGVNEHALYDLCDHFRHSGAIVRFIEYMDVGTLNGWELRQVVTAAAMVERIGRRHRLEPVDPNYRGEVANRYRFVDGGGEVGFIASVSEPFCGDCTRARLTPDGRLVTCLFAADGVDLRGLLRSGIGDDCLGETIAAIWTGRHDQYSQLRSQVTAGLASKPEPRIEMYQIGG